MILRVSIDTKTQCKYFLKNIDIFFIQGGGLKIFWGRKIVILGNSKNLQLPRGQIWFRTIQKTRHRICLQYIRTLFFSQKNVTYSDKIAVVFLRENDLHLS